MKAVIVCAIYKAYIDGSEELDENTEDMIPDEFPDEITVRDIDFGLDEVLIAKQ
jgi:hypothetical protein